MVQQLGQRVQSRVAFVLWLHAQIDAFMFQQVIGDQCGRQITQHLLAHRLAGDTLLQFSEGLDTPDCPTRLTRLTESITPDNDLTVHYRAVRQSLAQRGEFGKTVCD